MASNVQSLYSMRLFDEFAQKKTLVHSIHPLVKLVVTLGYIIAVVSAGKYSPGVIMPLVLYPFILIPLSEIPFAPIALRTLIVLPFVAGIGVFNPFFDRTMVFNLFGIAVSSGMISFITNRYDWSHNLHLRACSPSFYKF